MVSVKVFIVNENETNAILIWDETNQGLLIDPGFCSLEEFTSLTTFVKENNISIIKIALTHGHFDHVAGVKMAMQSFSCPVFLHKLEENNAIEGLEICRLKQWELCSDCKMFDYEDLSSTQSLVVGKQTFEILYTPGHSSGSICLFSSNNNLLLSGDTVFFHNYGRTDFDDGDDNSILESFALLSDLPDETYIVPGHGRPTSIGEERNNNPLIKLLKYKIPDTPYLLVKSQGDSRIDFVKSSHDRLILDENAYKLLRIQAYSIEFYNVSCLMGPQIIRKITKEEIGQKEFLSQLNSIRVISPIICTSYKSFTVYDKQGNVLISHSYQCLLASLRE